MPAAARRRVAGGSCAVLIAAGLTVLPASPAAAVACGGAAQNGLTITAAHDTSFYADLGQGFDAAYLGYKIANSGSARTNVWVTVGGFTGGSVTLADATDDRRQIASLPTSGTATAFFLTKASALSATAQTHTVSVYDRRPDLTGASVLATCDFSFAAVTNAQSANANKVTALSATPTSPSIGQTVTVTMDGQTGQANGAVWISPAAGSAWPTRALRLDSTTVQVDVDGDGAFDQTYVDSLYIPASIGSTYTASTTYRATFLFRVSGATATNPSVKPVAQISSGGQFKHTGSYPSLPTVAISGATAAITLSKAITTATLGSLPTTTSPNGVPGAVTYAEVPYRVQAATGSGTASVDEFVDVPATGVRFKNGSATLTDATPRSGVALSDPVTSTADTGSRAGALHFIGPFQASAATPASITYTMYVPLTAGTYQNQAFATINGTMLGASPTTVPTVTVTANGSALTGWSGGSTAPATTAQTITFAQPSDVAVTAGTRSVSATASSGQAVVFSSSTTGVCTVSGTTVTLVAAGTCTIAADQPGNLTYLPAPTVTRSFAVTKTAQTITFAQPADVALTAGTRTVSATASSGLAVVFSSSTTGVCTVSGTTVTLVAAGTCTIAADQAGNGSYLAAPTVSRSFAVTKTAQTITFGQPSDVPLSDGTRTVSASSSSGLAVTFSSSTTGVCTVSGTTVTLVAGGTCTIAADQAGDGSYLAAPTVSRSFAVTKTAQTITFGQPSDVPLSDGTRTVSASSSSGLAVTFSSSTTGVCTVSGTTVTLLAAGTCTIDADQAGDGSYLAANTVSRSFAVTKTAQTITFGQPSDVPLSDGTRTVSASSSSGLAVTFSSSTTGVCTVSGTTVTLVAAGTCTLDADQPGDGTFAAAPTVTRSFAVTGNTPVAQTITFAPPTDAAVTDGTATVSATASSGLAVTFSSSTPAVCTVSNGGGPGATVTLVSVGTCTLDADQPGDSSYAPAPTVTRSFAVTKGPQAITFGQPADAAVTDGTATVSATASSSLTVAFSSSTTGVCTVSGTTVTLVAVGTCTLDADQAGNGTYLAAPTVTRSFIVTKGPQTITFAQPSDVLLSAGTRGVSATADSGLTVAFSSSTTGVCTVSGTTVTLVAAGTCTLDADQAGDATYLAATTVTRSFAVSKDAQTITFPQPSDAAVDDGTVNVAATASSGLTVGFTSATPGICSVSASTVVLLAAGTCTIDADQAGNGAFTAAPTVTRSFTVRRAAQTITFAQPSGVPVSDGTRSVGATASSGLAVTFSSATTGVCTVSNGGGSGATVTLVSVGTCTIDADQAGDAYSAPAPTVTRSFAVTKAPQSITFAQPTDVAVTAATRGVGATASSGLAVVFSSATTGVCTVSGSTVTLVSVGTCTLDADQAGDATYLAATTVTRSFAVVRAGQVITFGQPADVPLGDGTRTVGATASSGLTVAFSSATTGVCTVSGTTVTLVTAGTCTLDADQPGDAGHDPAATVTRSFTVTPMPQTITFGQPADAEITDVARSLGATAGSGLTVSFSSTTTGVCSVSATLVTFHSTGTCTIDADQAGDARYAAAPTVTRSFAVTTAAQAITFPQPADVPLADGTRTVSASASSGLAVTLVSSTTGVCTVSGATVTLVAAGTCTLDADQPGDGTYAAATTVTRSFAVTTAPPTSQTITFGQPPDVLLTAGTATVSATSSSGLAVSFSSATAGVCTVSGTTVTLVAAGTCTIDADQAGGNGYGPATTVTRSFAVLRAGQTITFTQPGDVALADGTATVPASASSGLTVSLSSATAGVCTVSGITVTLVSAGTCTIDADQAGDATYLAATTVSRSFAVTRATQAITFPAHADAALGSGPLTLGATTTSGLAVTFTSTTTGVCTVSGTTLSLVATGTCTIDADQPGDAATDPAPTVTRSFTVTADTQTITFPQPSDVAVTAATRSVTVSASSGLPVSLGSTTTAVCTVTGTTVTLWSVGTCTIDADQAGDAGHAAAPTVTRSFAVTRAPQAITFTQPSDVPLTAGTRTVSASAGSGLPVTFGSTTPGVCTVANGGGTVTLVAVGTCTLEADQAGNGSYLAAPTQTRSFAVGRTAQTIAFAQPSDHGLTAGPVTLVASATSGLPVTFTSRTASVCTVAGALVTLLGGGTCTIDGDQAGDAAYGVAPTETRSFTVTRTPQAISFGQPADIAVTAGSRSLTATADSGLPVTFGSTTTGVCTVSGSGGSTTVALVATGTCTIEADQAGDAGHDPAATVTRSFAVVRGTQAITFPQPADAALADGTRTVAATAGSGLPVAFASTTPAVCGVSGHTVSFVTAGTCTVAADQAGDASWAPATTAVRSFEIGRAGQAITFPQPADHRLTDGTATLTGTSDAGLTVSYSSTSTPVCTVAGTTVTLLATGTCTIDADQAGNGSYLAAPTVTRSFAVTRAPQTITFPPPTDVAVTAGTRAVSAAADSGLAVAFESTTQSVCTVSNGGSTVVLLTPGTCTVRATQAGDAAHDPAAPLSRSFTITPGGGGPVGQAITFVQPGDAVLGGGPVTLVAVADSGLAVTLTSATPGVCTVSGPPGSVTATPLATGTCTIDADQAGNGGYTAAATVTRSFAIGRAAQTITFPAPTDVPVTTGTRTVAAAADSELPVTFTSTTPAVCTVSSGTVTLVATGTCTIDAVQAGDATHLPATVTRSFAVTRADQAITLVRPADRLATLGPEALAATADSGLPVDLGTTTPEVCSVSDGAVTPLAAGLCTVTADQPGDATYRPATRATQSFTISRAGQVLAFATPADATAGSGARPLVATADSGLPVAFESATEAVCTVSDGGGTGATVTPVAVGACTVLAQQAGDARYQPAAASRTFAVVPAGQSITFPAPADALLTTGTVTLGAVSDTGLAVGFEALTPSVCTVSGSEVTLVAAGTCTVRAVQPGDATHAAATPVERSFTVTAPPPPITATPVTTEHEGAGTQTATLPVPTGGSITLLDAQGDPATTVTVPGQGTYTLDTATGEVTFTPARGFAGTANPVTYRVEDGAQQTASSTFTAAVAALAAPPVARTLPQGSTVTATPQPRTPGAPLEADSLRLLDGVVPLTELVVPGVGTFRADTAAGRLEFVPAPGFVGTHQVTYRATDADGEPVEAVFTVTASALAISAGTVTVRSGQVARVQVLGLPGGATVGVPGMRWGASRIGYRAGVVTVSTWATFTGRIVVPVVVRNGTTEIEVGATVLVRPPDPAHGVFQLAPGGHTTVLWDRYRTFPPLVFEVRAGGGRVLCRTTASSCTVPPLLGPATPVSVVALGQDHLRSDPAPARYRDAGCSLAAVVHFAVGSAVLDRTARHRLDGLAAALRGQHLHRACVVGHTDDGGSAGYNQQLSEARADAVVRYLRARAGGVAYQASGRGRLDPVAPNATEAGRAANRRVEIGVG